MNLMELTQKQQEEIKVLSYEQLFPTAPGLFFLEKWGVYCKASSNGSIAILEFGCSTITAGKIISSLTHQMVGYTFSVTQTTDGLLTVEFDTSQLQYLNCKVSYHWSGKFVREDSKIIDVSKKLANSFC